MHPRYTQIALVLSALAILMSAPLWYLRLATPGRISRPTSAFNVTDFGAKGDGISDDSVAINRGIQAAKIAQRLLTPDPFDGPNRQPILLVFPPGTYRVRSSIDLTDAIRFTLQGDGAIVFGETAGKPVIDALGSRWLTIRGLTIEGDKLRQPNIGIQIGLTGAAGFTNADNQYFDNVSIRGYFGLTAFYNHCAETSTFIRFQPWNMQPGAFAMIQDGWNHFGIESQFLDAKLPRDSPMSFNENIFIGLDARSNGSGIWMGATSRHRFIGSYIAAADHGFVMFEKAGQQSSALYSDTHIELARDAYFFTSDAKDSANVYSWTIIDHGTSISQFELSLDQQIDFIAFDNAQFSIDGFQNLAARWFSEPRVMRFYGSSIFSGSAQAWATPGVFNGRLLLGFAETNVHEQK